MRNNYKNKKSVSSFYYIIFLYCLSIICWSMFKWTQCSANKTSILIIKYHGVRVNHGNAETSRDYKIIIVSLSLKTTFCWILTASRKFAVRRPIRAYAFFPCRPRAFYYLAEFLLPHQLVPVHRRFLLSFYFRAIVISDADNNVYTRYIPARDFMNVPMTGDCKNHRIASLLLANIRRNEILTRFLFFINIFFFWLTREVGKSAPSREHYHGGKRSIYCLRVVTSRSCWT